VSGSASPPPLYLTDVDEANGDRTEGALGIDGRRRSVCNAGLACDIAAAAYSSLLQLFISDVSFPFSNLNENCLASSSERLTMTVADCGNGNAAADIDGDFRSRQRVRCKLILFCDGNVKR